MYQVCYLFLLFFVYAMLGYFCEITFCSLQENKLVLNRGFCLGPYCPIYGVGAILMLLLLSKYKEDPIILILMSAIICSVVEYITSAILEKIFKARWWDYSNRKFNIEGRVCLEYALFFGLGGFMIIYIINPIITSVFNQIPHLLFIVIASICFVIFVVDVFLTVLTLSRIHVAQKKFLKKDATEEITKLIRLEIVKNKKLVLRLLEAFPHINAGDSKNSLYKVKSYLEKREKKKKRKFSWKKEKTD